ncbi:MAG: cytochrome c [Krumholzibacteria bacterium]|nr:cytochrome c [Candidatus Krumholzibacteria bacterium]
MKRSTITTAAALLLLLALAGCQGGGGKEDAKATAAGLNDGPKAAESLTLDEGLASWGEQIFKDKACVTCHALGERKQGPDLAGVADRRTERWLKRQIMDPEWMLKNDPIARGLMAEYALQMANQQVKDAEANALVQYLLRETLAGR